MDSLAYKVQADEDLDLEEDEEQKSTSKPQSPEQSQVTLSHQNNP